MIWHCVLVFYCNKLPWTENNTLLFFLVFVGQKSWHDVAGSHKAEIKVWFSSGDQSPPPSPRGSGRTQFLVIVELRSLLSCWLLAKGWSWLLVTTLRPWPHGSFLRLFTAELFAARKGLWLLLASHKGPSDWVRSTQENSFLDYSESTD